MNQLKLLIIIIFAFCVAVFAVSNPQPATLKFFNWEVLADVPTVIIVLGSMLFGVLITAILGFMAQSKFKSKLNKFKRSCQTLESKEDKLQLKIRKLEEQLEEEGIPAATDSKDKKNKKDS